ncbi:MAG TPA: hypothetical protein VJ201_03980 [Candidatus Babeliales bacterium]|nr:hypothetical protein [Candidatus Babeliales bacterium]
MKVSFYKYSMFLFFLVSGLKCAELPFSDQEMVNLDDLFEKNSEFLKSFESVDRTLEEFSSSDITSANREFFDQAKKKLGIEEIGTHVKQPTLEFQLAFPYCKFLYLAPGLNSYYIFVDETWFNQMNNHEKMFAAGLAVQSIVDLRSCAMRKVNFKDGFATLNGALALSISVNGALLLSISIRLKEYEKTSKIKTGWKKNIAIIVAAVAATLAIDLISLLSYWLYEKCVTHDELIKRAVKVEKIFKLTGVATSYYEKLIAAFEEENQKNSSSLDSTLKGARQTLAYFKSKKQVQVI